MIGKYLTGIVLVMALVAFGLVHEAGADSAGFGGTSTFSGTKGGPAGGGGGGGSGNNPCPPNNPHCGGPIAVPEPSSLILLATGLAGLACMVVLRKRSHGRRTTL